MIVVVIAFMAFVIIVVPLLRSRHNKNKREKRRCTFVDKNLGYSKREPCGRYTTRQYKMVHAPEGEEGLLKKRFDRYIIDTCSDGHIVCIEHRPKKFSLWKLAWRYLTDHKQFIIDEGLFEGAGVLDKAVSPLAERLMSFEEVKRLETERCKRDQRFLAHVKHV
jgi:hypothetical protein